jgi:uncharacterized membrane protein
VTIHPSKQYKNYDEIFSYKYEDGALYYLTCLETGPTVSYCYDDQVTLTLDIIHTEDPEIIAK